ncbi:MAG: zinc metallopeptidase [Bacteroidales bacterium]|nr:zinc metallopeptidase [Candidatus Cacconaster merdequi]
MYWILFIGVAIASYIVQAIFQSRIEKASRIPMKGGLTGAQVAEKMLRDNRINDVRVISTNGQLTDNFNPANKTVNLSESVYGRSSVAAAAVAAHECGHAVQHATGYFPVRVRSALVPVVSFASKAVTWVLLAGIALVGIFPHLILVGIGLFALTTLFSFVTLPVEINASRRALAWLETSGLTDYSTRDEAESALRAAAYTYVISALSSLATLIYYILVFTGGRRN